MKNLFFWKKFNKKQRLYFQVALGAFLIVLIPIIISTLSRPESSKASWFDDSWGFRQKVEITNSAGSNQTDYQVQITLDTQTLATNGKILTNCNDLRITDQNGKLLNYWIEPTTCNTTTTKIWVKIPSIPTTGQTLYLYYGNPSAVSVSSTTKTFVREINSLQGAWTMDEATWSATLADVLDSSGNSYHATAKGAANAAAYPTVGKFSNGGFFDGIDDYVDIGSKANLNSIGNSITASAWVKTSVNTGLQLIVGRANDWRIEKTGSSYEFEHRNTNNVIVGPSSVNSSTGWVHVVGTYDSNQGVVNLYLNGVLVNSQAQTGSTRTSQTQNQIGNSYAWHTGGLVYNDYFWNGQIDDVRIYNRALSAAEISDIYNNQGYTTTNYPNKELVRKRAATEPSVGITGSEQQAPSSALYFKFDEGTGTTVNDSSSNRALGSIAGATWKTEDQCVSGKCLFFNGSSDYVQSTNAFTDFSGTQDFSISVWVNPSVATTAAILSNEQNDESGYDVILTKDQKISFIAGGTIRDSLIGFWDPANTNSYSGTGSNWTDLSGKNYTLTVQSNVSYTNDANGIQVFHMPGDTTNNDIYMVGNADFNGVASGVSIDTAFNQDADFEANNTHHSGLFSKQNGLNNGGYELLCNTSEQPYPRGTYTTGNQFAGTALTVSRGTTYYTIYNWVSNQVKTYLDNSTTAWGTTNTGTIQPGTGNYYVGSRSGNVTAFKGNIYFNRVYSKGLSANEMEQNLESMAYRFGKSSNSTTTTTIPLNQYSHIEVTKSGTNCSIYINGNLSKSFTCNNSQSLSGNLQIGHRASGVKEFFKGYIDEVKVYPFARSAAQVKLDYASKGSVKGTSTSIGANSQLGSALSSGLVGYWKMDEATWSGTLNEVVDSSGNGNNGQAQGAASAMAYPTTGKFGNGGYFDGVDDYLQVATSPVLHPGDVFTLSAWVKRGSIGTADSIIAAYTNDYQLWFYSDNKLYLSKEGIGNVFQSTQTFTDTTSWHHIVATKNGSAVVVYYDGAVIAGTTANYTISATTQTIYIGGDGNASNVFSGQIDEVRIYNRALSPAEVSQLYNWAPGPIGYWNFEEGSGSILNDVSATSSANPGTWSGTGKHWTSGKFGKGGQFNGTNDYVNLGNNYNLSTTQEFSMSAWFKRTGVGGTRPRILAKRSATDIWYEIYIDDNSKLAVTFTDNYPTTVTGFAGTTVVADNTWYYVTMTRNVGSDKIYLYVNGVLENSATDATVANLYKANNFQISCYNGTTSCLKGVIDEVKYYNYAITQKQVVSDMNASHPVGGSPVGSQIGYWSFDEGYGTTIKNSGSAGLLNGTIIGALWKQDGKFGKSLSFGSNNYVSMGNPSALQITSDLTISAWVNVANIDATYARGIVSKFYNTNTNRGYRFGINSSSGTLAFQISDDGTSSTTGSSTTAITPNVWTHATVTYSASSGSANFYINGKLDKQVIGLKTSIYNVGKNFEIGTWDTSTANHSFVGSIDEVKVYNYSLTADEVKIDYNRGSSLVLGAMSNTSGITGGSVASSSASAEYCIPGDTTSCTAPVGRWDFEEGTGGTVNDTSGNGETGSWNGTGFHWKPGKFGKAGNFNGTNDWVSVGANGDFVYQEGNIWTVSLWLKTTGTFTGINGGKKPAGKATGNAKAGYAIAIGQINSQGQDNKVGFVVDKTTGYNYVKSTSSLPVANDGKWHFVSVVFDANSGTNITGTIYFDGISYGSIDSGVAKSGWATDSNYPFAIGAVRTSSTTELFPGQVDQVRVYNYARSAAQIAWDYNRGAPVGYWDFDECQGTMANDFSGNGNNGTITIGTGAGTGHVDSVGTCTTSSTAWGNGVNGKINASLSFDGIDDYVSATSTLFNLAGSSDISVSAWVYPTTVDGIARRILSEAGDANNGYALFYDSVTKNPYFVVNKSGTQYAAKYSTVLSTGRWYHIVGTYISSSNAIQIYINGVSGVSTSSPGAGIAGTFGRMFIGNIDNSTSRYWGGQIDDVKVFNYALTTAQVKTLYGNGAINFAPITGSP